MNGFVNTMLSAMLSWIRALISQIWALLSSEDGGALYQFLSANWLTMVVSLCAVCMLVDLIVYFFRWRPDYVWASKWRRLRRRTARRDEAAQELPPQEAFYAEEIQPQPELPTMAYAPLQAQTAVYAPVSQSTKLWQPVQELEEAAFDDADLWENEEPVEWDLQTEEPSEFGAPQPEPLAYFRDVQAGFAPAIPPEKIYAPSSSYQPPVQDEPIVEEAGVHPGLDAETFRQSVGLDEAPAAPASPVLRAPVFRPFTVTHEAEPAKSQGTFQRFAQRARDLIAMDDDQKTIRDLQSSVDVSKAFHEPVYPQSFKRDEE